MLLGSSRQRRRDLNEIWVALVWLGGQRPTVQYRFPWQQTSAALGVFTLLNAWSELDSLQDVIFGSSGHHSLRAEVLDSLGPVASAGASVQFDKAV